MRRVIFNIKQRMSPKSVLQIITRDNGHPERLIFRRAYRSFGWEKLTFSPLRISCLYTNDCHYSGCQFLSHAYDE